ncbi:MAG: hypothetical protein ACOX6T_25765, partial [Myxococcales bacterium]
MSRPLLLVLALVATGGLACRQDIRLTCGYEGERCCGSGQCRSGLACSPDGRCRACGTEGAVCCPGEKCGEGLRCAEGLCRCAAESDEALCASLGRDCGEVQATDGCGTTRTLDCGDCSPPMTCGGGGT